MQENGDLVILVTKAELDRFVGGLDPVRFYVSREAAEEAWRHTGQFTVVDLTSGWKVEAPAVLPRASRPPPR